MYYLIDLISFIGILCIVGRKKYETTKQYFGYTLVLGGLG
jgi:lipoprotein signal peptidase